MYMSELSPPAIRGSLVNLFSWWEMVGVLVAKGIVFGSVANYPTSQWSWRIGELTVWLQLMWNFLLT